MESPRQWGEQSLYAKATVASSAHEHHEQAEFPGRGHVLLAEHPRDRRLGARRHFAGAFRKVLWPVVAWVTMEQVRMA